MQLAPTLVGAYTLAIPTTVFWGILTGILAIGVWRRNRSVRLVSVLFVMIGPFLFFSDAGLMLGIPGAEQAIGVVLLAAGLAGIILSFIKK